MDELLKKAVAFLNQHPEINEVELEDGFHNRVHLVRFTSGPINSSWSWPPQREQTFEVKSNTGFRGDIGMSSG